VSTIAGKRCTRIVVTIPRYGQWQADVTADTTEALAGATSLVVGDLTLAGSIIPGRSGFDAPGRFRCVVKGGLLWDTRLTVTATRPARSYQSDTAAGVRLLDVLRQLAADCGSPALVLPADARIGAAWSRPASSALVPYRGVDALEALIARGHLLPWWVDPAGAARFTVRSAGAVTAAARVLDRDFAAGSKTLGVDSALAFLPGGTFEGVTIAKTIIRETSGELRLEVW
jgi:hypothetical protein